MDVGIGADLPNTASDVEPAEAVENKHPISDNAAAVLGFGPIGSFDFTLLSVRHAVKALRFVWLKYLLCCLVVTPVLLTTVAEQRGSLRVEILDPCRGDVNLDGVRDVLDLVVLLRHIRGAQLLTGDGLANADVTGDGSVDPQDVTRLRQHIVGLQPLPDCAASKNPRIASISPPRGMSGSNITITGANFDPNPAANTVKISELNAAVVSANTSQLVVTIPSFSRGGMYDVTVTTSGKTSNSRAFIVDRFDPTIEVAPLSLLPASSPPIFIRFSIIAGDLTANRMQISFNNVSFNMARFAGMTAPEGIGRGYITSTSAWVATASGIFLVTGSQAGGLDVVFSGTDGSQGSSGMVQGQIREVQSGFVMDLGFNLPSLAKNDLDANRYPIDLIAYLDSGLVTLPQTAAAPFSVTTSIDTPAPIGGKALNKSVPQTFNSVALEANAPRIRSIEPFQCRFRQEITLRGSGFGPSPADNTVTFAGINNARLPATVLSASSDALTVYVPAMAASGPVQVTRSGIRSNDFSAWVLYSPSLSVSLGNPAAGQTTALTVNLQEMQFQMATQNFLLTTNKGNWNYQALQKGAQIGICYTVGLYQTYSNMVVENTDGSTYATIIFTNSRGEPYQEAQAFLTSEQPQGVSLYFAVTDKELAETSKLLAGTTNGYLRFTAQIFQNPPSGVMNIGSWLTSCISVPGTKNVARASMTQQITVP